MTYKDIRTKIEAFEKNSNEAYMNYGDHDQTQEKWQFYLISKNKKDAALAALYDLCKYYRYAKQDEDLKNALMDNLDKIDQEDAIIEDEKQRKQRQDFNKIYRFILEESLNLNDKEFLKLIKYGEQKINEHIRRDKRIRDKNASKFINNIIKKINMNYDKYLSDLNKRQQRFFHVGTPKEEVEAYNNLVTKEEIMYSLLYNAINDAYKSSNGHLIISNALISACFEKFKFEDKSKDMFYDADAYDLSRNCFNIYKDAFEETYSLTKKEQEKLIKRLNNKIKEQ